MTLKDLDRAIIESPVKEKLVSEKVNFPVNSTGEVRVFIGISSFYEYIIDQIDGLNSLGSDVPNEIKISIGILDNVKGLIVDFIEKEISKGESGLLFGWGYVTKSFPTRELLFEYDSPVTEFLLEIFRKKKENYDGALHYLTNRISSGGIAKRNYLNGLILAYEFFQAGESDMKNGRDIEKSSLAKIRGHFNRYISDGEKNFIEFSASLKEKTDSAINEVLEYKTEKSKEYEKWFGDTSSSFSEFDKSSQSKIKDLENLYHEKLKLEAPAQYWNKRAKDLKDEGRWWLAGLILTIVAGVTIFIVALNWLANGVLEEVFKETASAIKWSVIFITLVSFLAFLIKTLSKMTFSTFHLSRDAEEREQLTYVFLAMQKEKAIDPTERHLIMQSLFSRADTGLLKDEGSPTMPGNIFDKIVASGK